MLVHFYLSDKTNSHYSIFNLRKIVEAEASKNPPKFEPHSLKYGYELRCRYIMANETCSEFYLAVLGKQALLVAGFAR